MFSMRLAAASGHRYLLVLCLVSGSYCQQPLSENNNATQAAPESARKAFEALGLAWTPAPKDAYLQAQTAFREGRNREALDLIDAAIHEDLLNGAMYGLRSGILAHLRRYDEGINYGDMGLTLSKTPRDKALAAYNKGLNLEGQGRKRESLAAYQMSIKHDPTYARAHLGVGKVYYFLKMWSLSKTALDKAITLNPQLAAAWAYRAEDLYKLGKVEDGLVSAQRAVELGPKDPRSYRARAIGYQLTKRYEDMLEDATKSIELDPDRTLAHLLRGRALDLLGRTEEALAEYAKEKDRDAVQKYLPAAHQALYGTRIYNCGDESTQIQTPENFNQSALEDCIKRVMSDLGNTKTAEPVKPSKRGLPSTLPIRKK